MFLQGPSGSNTKLEGGEEVPTDNLTLKILHLPALNTSLEMDSALSLERGHLCLPVPLCGNGKSLLFCIIIRRKVDFILQSCHPRTREYKAEGP